jgi:hypothetical protein
LIRPGRLGDVFRGVARHIRHQFQQRKIKRQQQEAMAGL